MIKYKRLFTFFLCTFLMFGFSCLSFADDEIPVTDNNKTDTLSGITENPNSSNAQVVVDITSLLTNSQDVKDDTIDPVEVIEPQLVQVEQTRQTISSSDANGFKAVILDLLGDYETVVTDYTYTSTQGYTSHSIEIEQDYAWICTACIFGLLVYCTFRTIGGICARF